MAPAFHEDELAGAVRRVQELVIERSKPHYPSFRVSILLVTVGMCVFFWGMAYKMSLYDTHRPTLHRIPEAKFLSKDEDPNATDSLRFCLANAPVQESGVIFTLVVAFIWSASNAAPVFNWIFRTPDRPRVQNRFVLSAFFFRPPPIQVL